MQKSKIITIIIIILTLAYILLSQSVLWKLGDVYTYIINPGFWIMLVIALRVFLIPIYHTKKFKKTIIEYVLITVLIYIIIYFISGLFVEFGKNPYATSLYGLFLNLIISGSVIVAREYIRYRLIHNVYQKDQKTIGILITIIFTLSEFNTISFFSQELNGYLIFKQIFYKIIPLLLKNTLFTYIAYKTDYVPNIIYDLLIKIFLWMAPILPKAPWVMDAIVDSVFPLILLFYIRYNINKKSRFEMERKTSEGSNPAGLIPLSIILILLIWFALGLFPIRPVAIASGSMVPAINVGDVAIIKKCTPNDVVVGDIIEYQMDGYTVIHRIINIYQEKGEFFYITKGDSNQSQDRLPVSEDQLIGKVLFRIRYLGFPAIWLHNISSQVVVDVETGG